MARSMAVCLVLGLWTASSFACSDSRPQVGTQSNWLVCRSDDQCAAGAACLCGFCSSECEARDDCAALDQAAVCAAPHSPGLEDRCGGGASMPSGGLCVRACNDDADCTEAGDATRCSSGLCVPAVTANDAGTPPDDTPRVPDDSMRTACLEPPWVLAPDDPRVETVACDEAAETAFELPGDTPASFAQVLSFLEAHQQDLHASFSGVISSGAGICCDGAWREADPRCISIGIRLCTTPVAAIAEQLLAWQRADAAAASLRFNISIGQVGLLEPRCPPGECGPVPYNGVERDAPEAREIIESQSIDGPRCEDDGECLADGCGNDCVHWTAAGGAGTCDRRSVLEDAFCGCAENRCAWFE